MLEDAIDAVESMTLGEIAAAEPRVAEEHEPIEDRPAAMDGNAYGMITPRPASAHIDPRDRSTAWPL
jgi:hypothetical protein